MHDSDERAEDEPIVECSKCGKTVTLPFIKPGVVSIAVLEGWTAPPPKCPPCVQAEWAARFMGASGSIFRPVNVPPSYNDVAMTILSCARCGGRFPAGSTHHCPTKAVNQ